MNVFVVGGTGFIGYHTVRELQERGHTVTVLARRPLTRSDLLPAHTRIVLGDLSQLPDDELRALLQGHDALVFAAGADDRTIPKSPAYDFFYEANVRQSVRLFTLARQAGVKRGVLLGSYFAYFDRIWPELQLSEHHPYIRSRREQERQALDASLPDLELMILELPYIFGAMPGRTPLWAPLIQYLRWPVPLFYMRGGTNMVSVKHVAEAIAGALERGKAGERYVVGDENLTWGELLGRLSTLTGLPKRVITLPNALVNGAMHLVHLFHKWQGKEGGLNMLEFGKLQMANTFFDPGPSRLALGYGQGGLAEALRDTVRACLPRRRAERASGSAG